MVTLFMAQGSQLIPDSRPRSYQIVSAVQHLALILKIEFEFARELLIKA